MLKSVYFQSKCDVTQITKYYSHVTFIKRNIIIDSM